MAPWKKICSIGDTLIHLMTSSRKACLPSHAHALALMHAPSYALTHSPIHTHSHARPHALSHALISPLMLVSLVSAIFLSACGFHLPNQTKLDETLPEINIIGDYQHAFYKKVVNQLKANGIEVYAQSSDYMPDLKQNIPALLLPAPQVQDEVVSVNSHAQSIENSLLVSIAATLNIPNHTPISMSNSITRSVLHKSGQSLSSDTEKAMVLDETYDQLANELVMRLSYLGRSSDPDAQVPQPNELTYIPGEDDPEKLRLMKQQTSGLTLMEALQLQNQYENLQGHRVSYDELNNGQSYMTSSDELYHVVTQDTAAPNSRGRATIIVPADKSYSLPKVQPQRLHQAPADLY